MTIQRMLPLYQGIMAEPFNHRAADVVRSATAQKRQNQPSYLAEREWLDPERVVQPMYWVREQLVRERLPEDAHWLLTFRDVTSPTNARTLVPAAIPVSGVGHKTPIVLSRGGQVVVYAAFASFVMDYVARQKLGGTSMTYMYVNQFPIVHPGGQLPFTTQMLPKWIGLRVMELSYSSHDMSKMGINLDDFGPPFVWNVERRFWLRAEMDAAFFHLYGIERADVDYIMETFPIVKRKDIAAHGEFRTKLAILDIYDKMQEAIDSGGEYQTVLDPPPGEGPRHPMKEASDV